MVVGALRHRLCVLLLLVGALVLGALSPCSVFACSCVIADEAPDAALRRAAAVFAGKAVVVDNFLSRWVGRPVQVTFEVSRVWKGAVGRHVVIKTGSGGSDCGVAFRRGEEYIVYAYDAQGDPLLGSGLAANSCGKTDHLADAREDLAVLGAGVAPILDNTEASTSLLLPIVAMVGGALALAAVAVMRVRRRTNRF